MRKKIVSIDFDGVIHSYTSGWKGAAVIPDPTVPGAIEWLVEMAMSADLEPHIFSSRSHQVGGKQAMMDYIFGHIFTMGLDMKAINYIEFPYEKPPAFVSIDDRGITFTGTFPSLDEIRKFVPWNKKGV
jgi:hypothetical protein